eukprot:EG_transcript_35922
MPCFESLHDVDGGRYYLWITLTLLSLGSIPCLLLFLESLLVCSKRPPKHILALGLGIVPGVGLLVLLLLTTSNSYCWDPDGSGIDQEALYFHSRLFGGGQAGLGYNIHHEVLD